MLSLGNARNYCCAYYHDRCCSSKRLSESSRSLIYYRYSRRTTTKCVVHSVTDNNRKTRVENNNDKDNDSKNTSIKNKRNTPVHRQRIHKIADDPHTKGHQPREFALLDTVVSKLLQLPYNLDTEKNVNNETINTYDSVSSVLETHLIILNIPDNRKDTNNTVKINFSHYLLRRLNRHGRSDLALDVFKYMKK